MQAPDSLLKFVKDELARRGVQNFSYITATTEAMCVANPAETVAFEVAVGSSLDL